jgi:hypothetical protein
MLCLLRVALCICLVLSAEGLSDGPGVPDSCITLAPDHNDTQEQDGAPPTSITVAGVTGPYIPGAGTSLTGILAVGYRYHAPHRWRGLVPLCKMTIPHVPLRNNTISSYIYNSQ